MTTEVRNIVLLGSTGSVGRNCLSIARELPGRFRVVALAVDSDVDGLAEQVEEFRPLVVGVREEKAARELERRFGSGGVKILAGESGVARLAGLEEGDIVVNAIVGAAGLLPTVEAVKAGKRLALANKESLVLAGQAVVQMAKERGAEILPVDSEHSGVHQCVSSRRARIRRIVLTASGGPLLGRRTAELADVTPEEVLRHPVWKMGRRICVDSATLFNKGLEVMEARWLFDVELDEIGVLVHPEGVVHAMVEFVDGTTLAQISAPDMRVPILYALTYPETVEAPFDSCDLSRVSPLTFMEPDLAQFPCLALAYDAAKAGGTVPASLNAADEVAVKAFLDGRIRFTDITRVLEQSLGKTRRSAIGTIQDVLDADSEARAVAEELVRTMAGGVQG
ncbi:MAG: 1-deoxy-D-xylulose-5-phosphate reductoisomerase [Candidatus Eisenbacteria bacterium]